MDLNKFITNTATLAVGGSAVVIIAYYIIRNDIMEFLNRRRAPVNVNSDKDSLLHLRLQAHERMIVFVDRINPANLFLRLHQSNLEASALQILAVNEIKNEFQHNITQQLYLSPSTWNVVRNLKEDTIAMINNAVKNLPEQAAALALSKAVLTHMSTIEENPYELTIGLIKKDIFQEM